MRLVQNFYDYAKFMKGENLVYKRISFFNIQNKIYKEKKHDA